MSHNYKLLLISLFATVFAHGMEESPNPVVEEPDNAFIQKQDSPTRSGYLTSLSSLPLAVANGIGTGLNGAYHYAASAKRAADTRVYPGMVFGIGFGIEESAEAQAKVEQRRTLQTTIAMNQELNGCFSSSEEDLPVARVDEGITAKMCAKRLANLPDTIVGILKQPNDIATLDDIGRLRSSIPVEYMPPVFDKELTRKEKHIQKHLAKRTLDVRPISMEQSVLLLQNGQAHNIEQSTLLLTQQPYNEQKN